MPKEPILTPTPPTRPFQHRVSDMFDMAARLYVVYADRYSGWIEVAHCQKADAAAIKKVFRKWFITFGVPEELSCNGGPQYASRELRSFLQSWGVRIRQSSAYYPQSNGRAEAAVKSMKRILSCSVGPDGSLDNDNAARALLLQRNTPLHESDLSPSEIVFGRPIRDHLPQIDEIRREWKDISRIRERTFSKRNMENASLYNKFASKPKKQLYVGESVAVQDNIHGKKRWQQTGVVVESKPDIRQYLVRVDGSNKVTRRNRRHLRPIISEHPDPPVAIDDTHNPRCEGGDREPEPPTNVLVAEVPPTDVQTSTVPKDSVTPVRRSERIRRPVVKLDL